MARSLRQTRRYGRFVRWLRHGAAFSPDGVVRSTCNSRQRPVAEALEPRLLLSVNVVSYHGDPTGTGLNPSETVLGVSNVNATDFGKAFSVTLDGQVYAQPLYVQNLDITRGPSPGIHSVVFAATENDSLYAIDANTGQILWQDTFQNIADPTNLTATAGVIAQPVAPAVGVGTISPETGITSTPAIDLSNNTLFLTAATQEIRGADIHFVYRLWAVSLSDGSATMAPAVIGDTIFNNTNYSSFSGYQYVSGPLVVGTGNNTVTGGVSNDLDGWINNASGFNPATSGEIGFNALMELQRPAVSLINGILYLGFGSHADDGPYYGWLLGYREADLSLASVFNTAPTNEPFSVVSGNRPPFTAQAAIWDSGAGIVTDGTYLYVPIGNGDFNPQPGNFSTSATTSTTTYSALGISVTRNIPAGFPLDQNYGDSLVKLALDPTSSPTNQNGNGWGVSVVDYFAPSNVYELNSADIDMASGGITLLPNSLTDTAGNPMLVTGGKEGRIYLLDRNNLGKFNYAYVQDGFETTSQDPRPFDRVVGEFPAHVVNVNANDTYSAATYFNGDFYYGLASEPGWAFSVAQFEYPGGVLPPLGGPYYTPPIAAITSTISSSSTIVGTRGAGMAISANGSSDGIVWGLVGSSSTNSLVAYDASTSSGTLQQIYSSDTNLARDSLTGGVAGATTEKFTVPIIANGMVYAGTGGKLSTANNATGSGGLGTLVSYGLLDSYLTSNASYFSAPSGLAAQVSTTSPSIAAELSWTSNSSLAAEFRIDRSTDGTNFTTVGYVSGDTTTYRDATITANTPYVYRVEAVSGANVTAASNTAGITSAVLVSAASVKTQGSLGSVAINLPLTGAPGIEDRVGGPTQLVLTFQNAITLGPGFIVRLSSGTVGSTNVSADALTINLSGAANAQTLVVELTDVQDTATGASGDYALQVGVLAGDANGDGVVDFGDFAILSNSFGQANAAADFNSDGIVDSADFAILSDNFGATLSASVAATTNTPATASAPAVSASPAAISQSGSTALPPSRSRAAVQAAQFPASLAPSNAHLLRLGFPSALAPIPLESIPPAVQSLSVAIQPKTVSLSDTGDRRASEFLRKTETVSMFSARRHKASRRVSLSCDLGNTALDEINGNALMVEPPGPA